MFILFNRLSAKTPPLKFPKVAMVTMPTRDLRGLKLDETEFGVVRRSTWRYDELRLRTYARLVK